jgi:hypothetical protein
MPSTPSHPLPQPCPTRKRRPFVTRLALIAALCCASTWQIASATPPGATTAKPAAAKSGKAGKAGKPATPRQQLKSEASGLALATATAETINQAQLDVAARVLTGTADCEFKQSITVQPVDGQPGYFTVGHKGQRYTMVPEETATGAVRLQDKRAGVVWLQIPTKSMLMNARLGQRMVDACQHAEQRIAVNAAADAGAGLGIVPQPAAAPAAQAAASSPS